MTTDPQGQAYPAPAGGAGGLSRVLGVYPQKQSGLFMQRIKVPGGRINWPQWRRVAELAARYSGGTRLHLTTRQDIELHNVPGEDVAAVQQGLAEVALPTFGAGGDTVRNITTCAGCDFCDGGFDLFPLAQLVRQGLDQEPVIFRLPRKFKISFSGCPRACAKPWLNDLGFVAQSDGRLTLIGAGSLGPKPAPGIHLYENMAAQDVLPTCLAALELFEQYGERQDRRHARLRHVRERLGDDAFKAELARRLEHVKARQPWPHIAPAPLPRGAARQYRLQPPNGNMTSAQALQLADAGQTCDAVVRIDLEQGLSLYGPQPVQMPDDLAAMTVAPTIVACPGSTTCPRGLADCGATADKIRATFSSHNLSGVRINISGCPNNCAQSTVAQIGLVGLVRPIDGQPTPHYRLFTDGGNGMDDRLAQPSAIVPADDVPGIIRELLA